MDLRFCASGMREQGYGKLVFSFFFSFFLSKSYMDASREGISVLFNNNYYFT
jgi:hypothetical protein